MLATSASLLSRIHTLPTVPKVVQELIATFDQPEINLPRVARLVNTDPVIAAKVLRLANSAYYRRSRTVTNIDEAIVFMGLDALRMLVVGAGFAASVPVPSELGRALFWRYCLHTAVCARYFACQSKEDPQAAFTAGLLHAIGEPLMLMSMEGELRDVERQARFYDPERALCERSRVGFAYSDLGAELAESWRFPPAMVAAIREAPEPLAGKDFSRLAACINLGSHFAAGVERHQDMDTSLMTLDSRVLEAIGLDLGSAGRMPPPAKLAQGLEELVG
ncbi:MAG: HDOD domain-containing protein [Stagnimonas sp.]|nr:HDOD domain-containing protein [Stagnimonas sp.]